jgi:hypothetical protein
MLGGVFKQILPVVPRGTRDGIVHASLNNSVLWPKFKVVTLKENMCLSVDKLGQNETEELHEFADWILSIGNGDISDLTSP